MKNTFKKYIPLAARGTDLKPGQYRCGMCHEVFYCGWTKEEARAEAEKNGFRRAFRHNYKK